MELFDEKEMQRKHELEQKYNQPDEHGFVTVVRKGRKNNSDGLGCNVAAFSGTVEKKETKGLVDFYRFQMREKKRDELAELRRKFEQDKQQISQMKDQNRFKPY